MSGDSTVVSGPGCEGRTAPSLGAGISLAQTLAVRHQGDGAFYVRTPSGRPLARIERVDRCVVTFTLAAVEELPA